MKKDSDFDRKRNSPPFERHVFHAVTLEAKKLVVSASHNLEEAVRDANAALKVKSHKHNFKTKLNIKDKDVKRAYLNSVDSLNKLTTDKGILAGLPWFFQTWTRDELISVNALNLIGRHAFAKDLIFNNFSHIKKMVG